MALTPVACQGRWTRPDGSPSQGTATLALSSQLRNGSVEVSPGLIAAVFDGMGRLCAPTLQALIVDANDDSTTSPVGSWYEVDLTVDGTALEAFRAVIAHAATATETNGATNSSTTVTLANLIAASSMVGQAITGTNIPGGTTVTAYSYVPSGPLAANTLTLSQAATGTQASGCSFVIGGAVDLGTLVPVEL